MFRQSGKLLAKAVQVLWPFDWSIHLSTANKTSNNLLMKFEVIERYAMTNEHMIGVAQNREVPTQVAQGRLMNYEQKLWIIRLFIWVLDFGAPIGKHTASQNILIWRLVFVRVRQCVSSE